jgi:hypothetical protein
MQSIENIEPTLQRGLQVRNPVLWKLAPKGRKSKRQGLRPISHRFARRRYDRYRTIHRDARQLPEIPTCGLTIDHHDASLRSKSQQRQPRLAMDASDATMQKDR